MLTDLRRATDADRPAVEALQRVAYAPNQVALGVVPIPLQAGYVEIFAIMEVWVSDRAGTIEEIGRASCRERVCLAV